MPSRDRQPTDVIQGLRASTAGLLLALTEANWTDAEVAADTRLPDWTRGHLLTHLARNADSVAGTLAGALRGEIVEQYPGGREQRSGDIAAGADRPMAALLADVRDSAERLDRVLGALSEADAWERKAGDDVPAHEWLPLRWLEVETHRVDLDCGYSPDRWPPLFVATLLPVIAPSLSYRTDEPLDITEVRGPDWAVLAWLMGRVEDGSPITAPALRPWRGVRR